MPWKPIELATELERAHETTTFDVKSAYDFALQETGFDVAKDVAAFASAMGGTILVGAHEAIVGGRRTGRIGAFESVPNTGALIADVSREVTQRCRPLPTIHPVAMTLDRDEQRRALGREPTTDSVDVVAINVFPLLTGPIGVRPGPRGALDQHGYRFPIRSGEQSDYLTPERLALHMNIHDRKIGVLLHEVGVGTRLRVFEDHNASNLRYRVAEIDDTFSILVLEFHQSRTPAVAPARVPFSFIRAVWKDHQDWNAHIEGILFDNVRDPSDPTFRPRRI